MMQSKCATARWIESLAPDDAAALAEKVKHGAAIRALHRVARHHGAPGITCFREHLTDRCVCVCL